MYNGECAVCVRIAEWARASSGDSPRLTLRPIGDDPEALERLHPGLDIWDAYGIVHLLMPDGSMKTGGDAVAEVLRLLPNVRGLSRILDVHAGSFRPGAVLLDLGYTALAEVRPLLGCASCGSTNASIRTVHRAIRWLGERFGALPRAPVLRHGSALSNPLR